jgi:hypothetical protein
MMESHTPWPDRHDTLAVTLLAGGCLAGLSILIVRPTFVEPAPAGVSELRERIHVLEQRLLEQVPPAIEQRYQDL